MKKILGIGRFLCILTLFGLTVTMVVAAEETRLLRYPDINGDGVVFVYAGDLWTVGLEGGNASRLTTHPGDELFPKYSPDGRWIAFTGEYDGNSDVFLVPANGGEPRRLTYHPSADNVLGWTPDGKHVLFRSDRVSAPPGYNRLFLVSPDGGLPEPLPIPRGSLSSFSPDGKKIAYNPLSREFRTWKRYRGGLTSNIGIYDLENDSYEELPRVKSNDLFPMWHGDGIYFVSDRDRVMNLYRYDLGSGETRQLTTYTEYDVKWPSLGKGRIVYENGGKLFRMDLASEAVSPVPAIVPSELLSARPEIRSVGNFIGSMDISPSGKRAVFGARGEVFTVPAEHGAIRNLTGSSGVHELNPSWSPDGKWLAYLSDRTGEYELYLRPHKGGDEVRITADGQSYRFGPSWSPDSKKLMYRDKELRLWYVDIEEKKPVLVYRADYRGVGVGVWSPDSRWIAYSVPGRASRAIWLYSLEDGDSHQVTDTFYNDTSPVFDPEGKYLFFLSDRYFHPAGDRFDWHFAYFNTRGIFAVTLKADTPSPFAPRSDDEEPDGEGENGGDKDGEDKDGEDADKKKDDKGKKAKKDRKKDDGDGDDDGEKKKDGPEPIEIDLEGITDRIVTVPVTPGTYFGLDARKGKLYYFSLPFEAQQAGRGGGEGGPRGSLHVFDLKERESKPLMSGIDGYVLDREGKKILYAARGQYGIVDAMPGKAKVGEGTLSTSNLQANVVPREEWKQIFREAWRIERDFFYDPEMHGLDWEMIGKRYEALLPWVSHRSDLNYIIGEMIAELATSHSYVGGGQMPQRRRVGVGLLGIDFGVEDGHYTIARIYRGENWNRGARSPLTEPGLKVSEGTYILAVNDRELKVPDNPYSHFQGLAGQVVELKVNDKPGDEGARTIMVETLRDEGRVRYLDWIETNRRKVDEATGGRVGYMHVPDTAIDGLMQFDKYLSGQLDKDAMIVDERYNRGGMIPDFYTEKLQRKLMSFIAPREGKDVPWPPTAIYGPKVMIINERAGSGGDAFPWFFKHQKIGPLVGTTTWGGLVGISRNIPLMDGGGVTAPEIGFWNPENGGQWIAENEGIHPDYEVRQRPDLVVKGHDPQLEKAIELTLELLQDYEYPTNRPPYPKGR